MSTFCLFFFLSSPHNLHFEMSNLLFTKMGKAILSISMTVLKLWTMLLIRKCTFLKPLALIRNTYVIYLARATLSLFFKHIPKLKDMDIHMREWDPSVATQCTLTKIKIFKLIFEKVLGMSAAAKQLGIQVRSVQRWVLSYEKDSDNI